MYGLNSTNSTAWELGRFNEQIAIWNGDDSHWSLNADEDVNRSRYVTAIAANNNIFFNNFGVWHCADNNCPSKTKQDHERWIVYTTATLETDTCAFAVCPHCNPEVCYDILSEWDELIEHQSLFGTSDIRVSGDPITGSTIFTNESLNLHSCEFDLTFKGRNVFIDYPLRSMCSSAEVLIAIDLLSEIGDSETDWYSLNYSDQQCWFWRFAVVIQDHFMMSTIGFSSSERLCFANAAYSSYNFYRYYSDEPSRFRGFHV
jgi:hypothetical protein